MAEITEIDMNKYIVFKKDDVDKYLISGWKKELERISLSISECRKADGKKDNNYLVLNLDDEIDKNYLIKYMRLRYEQFRFKSEKMKVSNIAVALVNAILKAKGE